MGSYVCRSCGLTIRKPSDHYRRCVYHEADPPSRVVVKGGPPPEPGTLSSHSALVPDFDPSAWEAP